MSKHTPGPWEISGCTIIPGTLYVYSKKGEYLAKVLHENDKKCQANARLIAAAPRMYELLDEARKIVRDMPPDWNYQWDTLAMAIKNIMDKIDGQEDSHA
ncbi:MAG TPA: hypothetical protein PK572_09580 [Kiritimatiellia bacterium]|nr:hypothetical protein [Kiritimatiellia bacterium]